MASVTNLVNLGLTYLSLKFQWGLSLSQVNYVTKEAW